MAVKRSPCALSMAAIDRCGTEAGPACPYDSLPGWALARVTRSCSERMGDSWRTASAKTFSNGWHTGSICSGLKGIVVVTKGALVSADAGENITL
jgi:hypothetical protein